MYRSAIYLIALSLACLGLSVSFSQNANSKWYFGNKAGLDFMTSPPTILTGSMNTSEGCSSIADHNGNLLFYTDGVTVWDQNHNVMANGTGLNGNSTTSQSAIIIKQTGNSSKYFIFTLSPAGTGSLCVSEVDKSLAGGSGSVTIKNQLISTGNAEKLTYTRHCNGHDWWVVTHADLAYQFRSYLVSGSTVSSTPVISNIGPAFGVGLSVIAPTNQVAYYCMKLSPNGKKIAQAMITLASITSFTQAGIRFLVYDFDNTTGQVANMTELFPVIAPLTSVVPYSCEFSPDASKLYGITLEGEIYQWNLCAGSDSAINASRYQVQTGSVVRAGSQLAPDGKIYIAQMNSNSLSVINNPNAAGAACNYVASGQSIFPNQCKFGLPNHSPVKVPPPPFTHTTTGCFTTSFSPPPLSQIETYTYSGCASTGYSVTGMLWNFGDPAGGATNISTQYNPVHNFSGLGSYQATLIIYYSCTGGTDTLRQNINITQPCYTITSSNITCSTLGSASVSVAGLGPYTYTWLPSAQSGSVATGLAPGTYSLYVTHVNSGISFSAQPVFVSPVPLASTVQAQDSLNCNAASNGTAMAVSITGGSGNYTYSWINGFTFLNTPSVSTLGAGNWTLTLTDNLTGCISTNSFVVSQPSPLQLSTGAQPTAACTGESFSVSVQASGGSGNYQYQWGQGGNQPAQVVTPPSSGVHIYTVLVTDSKNCPATATVALQSSPVPSVTVTSASICPQGTAVLSAGGATSYTWHTGSTLPQISASPSVTSSYTVLGSAGGCTANATGSVVVLSPPALIVSGQNSVCTGQNTAFNAAGAVSYSWSGPANFQSFSSAANIFQAGNAHAGTYSLLAASAAGCTNTATFSLQVSPLPTLAVSSFSLCNGDSIVLQASTNAAGVSWTGPGGFQSNATQAVIHNAGVLHTGQYNATALLNGCSQTASLLVSVVNPPPLVFSLSSPSMCNQALNGSPATITLSAGGAVTYTLHIPPYLASTNVHSPPMVLNTQPPYQPTVSPASATLVGSNGPCIVAKTVTFEIVPNPTISPITATPVICAGQSYTYTSQGADSFTWTMSNPGLTTYTSPVTVASPSVTSTLSVLGGSLGCNSSIHTSTITVYAIPSVSIFPADPKVCMGSALLLSAAGSAHVYSWLPGNGLPAGSLNFSVSAQPTVNTTYTVIGSANNCTSYAVSEVTVLPLPKPEMALSHQSVCVGQDIVLTGKGGVRYFWKTPGGTKLEGQPAYIKVSSQALAGYYELTVSDSNDCSASTGKNLFVFDPPLGQIHGLMNGCAPLCTELFFTGASAKITPRFSIENKHYSGSSFKHCFIEPGIHTINANLKDASTTCTSSMVYQVEVFEKPVADFEFTPDRPVEGLDPVVFTDLSQGEQINKWTWVFMEQNTYSVSTQNTSQLFEQAGTYPIALVSRNSWGCSDTLVKAITIRSDFNIYVPNVFTPNADSKNENFLPIVRGVKLYHLQVFNRWGQQLFDTVDPLQGWDGFYNGELSKQDSYIWRINLSTSSGEKKEYTGSVLLVR